LKKSSVINSPWYSKTTVDKLEIKRKEFVVFMWPEVVPFLKGKNGVHRE
jgi:hypothetical protein